MINLWYRHDVPGIIINPDTFTQSTPEDIIKILCESNIYLSHDKRPSLDDVPRHRRFAFYKILARAILLPEGSSTKGVNGWLIRNVISSVTCGKRQELIHPQLGYKKVFYIDDAKTGTLCIPRNVPVTTDMVKTVMGLCTTVDLLQVNYIENSTGVNLFKQAHPTQKISVMVAAMTEDQYNDVIDKYGLNPILEPKGEQL